MFTIQSNNEIRINKGDTFYYPFLLNLGDKYNENIYPLRITPIITTSLQYKFDEDIWRNKVLESGTYTFTKTAYAWNLDNEEVDIIDYGIEILSNPVIGDTFIIEYSLIDNDSKIYFEIWPILQDPEFATIQKIFVPSLNVIKTYYEDTLISSIDENVVDSEGRVILKLNESDTGSLERGKYLYQIRAYLYNEIEDDYDMITLTNRTPLYIIDDNFTQRVW